MKKLLLIFLPISLFLLSCGGGDIQPVTQSLEETLVGKKWCLSNDEEDGFLLSPGGGFFTTQKCTPHDWEGSWIIENNLIKYSITTNSIQSTILWGEVSEYSSTQVKILINNSSTLTSEAIYSLTAEDVYGCADTNSTNYDSLATCNDGSCIPFIYGCTDSSAINYYPEANTDDGSCFYSGELTYIPDSYFEQALIDLGYDDVLDGSVYTQRINTITTLALGPYISAYNGIEDFSSLTILNIGGNQMQNPILDLSNNIALEELNCYGIKLTTIDLSNNTNLKKLYINNSQISSLDLNSNTLLEVLECEKSQLTSLDLSNNTALTNLECKDNQLTSINVSNSIALVRLICYSNSLTSLDLSNNVALTRLHCASNQLSSLDLSQNTALQNINVSQNNLISLDVRNGNNINIEWVLNSNGNRYYSFTVRGNPNLTCVNVDDSLFSTNYWTNIDPQHYFSEDCP